MDKPESITTLLQESSSHNEQLLLRARYLQHADRLLHSLLNAEFKLHCRVANIRDGLLILDVDSVAWATRLRYQLPSLLEKLQQHEDLRVLSSIEIKIRPQQQTRQKSSQRPQLSPEAAHCIHSCAEGIDDPALGNALRRLASRKKS